MSYHPRSTLTKLKVLTELNERQYEASVRVAKGNRGPTTISFAKQFDNLFGPSSAKLTEATTIEVDELNVVN
jgi:hypothetical protein